MILNCVSKELGMCFQKFTLIYKSCILYMTENYLSILPMLDAF